MSPRRLTLARASAVWAVSSMLSGCTGCASESSGPVEPDLAEQAVARDAIDTELALTGALVDDQPEARTLSATVPDLPLAPAEPISPGSAALAPAVRPWPITRPLHKLLRGWGIVVPVKCTTSQPWVDDDHDGIPAVTSLTFDCTSPEGAPIAYQISGSAFVLDMDDHVATDGYWLGFQRFTVRSGNPSGVVWTRTFDGSIGVISRRGSPPGGFDFTRKLTVVIEHAVGGQTSSASVKLAGTVAYAPDVDLEPGARSTRGTMTSSARTTVTNATRARLWTWRTDPTLHWDVACRREPNAIYGFDRGAAIYEDEHDNELRIEVTSCTSRTLTLNGHPL